MHGVAQDETKIARIVEKRLREEIRRGVQTIQYQVVTLLTTNGQAPFITVFMYLNEARSEQEKRDLALIIEEMLLQRYEGVKNEQGVWVTPAFPKLIYVLEEDNIHDDSPYYYLCLLYTSTAPVSCQAPCSGPRAASLPAGRPCPFRQGGSWPPRAAA